MINVKAAKAAVSHYKAELADIKKVLSFGLGDKDVKRLYESKKACTETAIQALKIVINMQETAK